MGNIYVFFKYCTVSLLILINWAELSGQTDPSGVERIAKTHNLISDTPGPDFFEGDLLGNGGLGLCITTRPDAMLLHLGHNNVWDQRLSEIPLDSIGKFKDVYSLILGSRKRLEAQGLKDPHPLDITQDTLLNNYIKNLSAIGDKQWPRPFPCGTLYLAFDPLKMYMVKRELNISNGIWTITYNRGGDHIYIDVFVVRGSDKVLLKAYDAKGNGIPLPFTRFRILPHDDSGSKIPSPQTFYSEEKGLAGWSQHLPKHAPLENEGTPHVTHEGDKAFTVTLRFDKPFKRNISRDRNYAVPIVWWQDEEPYVFTNNPPTYAELHLTHGAADSILKPIELGEPINWLESYNSQSLKTTSFYKEYWNKSSISLADKELEKVWYRNTYFSSCVIAPGYQCPGLYGNFIYKDIGTAWHGDYHFNYNVQQSFWGIFSSNRIEQHEPYIELIKQQMPLGKSWARSFYEMPGLYIGLSGYPFVGKTLPHYNPVYSNYMSTTPWAVQSLWWHYLYTQDTELLRSTLYPILKDAAIFMNA
ncbi:MAG TPA: glycoside hydrolase N-terminal domain-containing protein, partial [Cytophagaceae bacterium]